MPFRNRVPEPDDPDSVADIDEAARYAWESALAAKHGGDPERAQMHMQYIDSLLDKRNRATNTPGGKA